MAAPYHMQPMAPVYGKDFKKYEWTRALSDAFDVYGDYKRLKEAEAKAKRDEAYRRRAEEREIRRLEMAEEKHKRDAEQARQQTRRGRRRTTSDKQIRDATPEATNPAGDVRFLPGEIPDSEKARKEEPPLGPTNQSEEYGAPGRQQVPWEQSTNKGWIPRKYAADSNVANTMIAASSTTGATPQSQYSNVSSNVSSDEQLRRNLRAANAIDNPQLLKDATEIQTQRVKIQQEKNLIQDEIHQAEKEGHLEKTRLLEIEKDKLEIADKKLEHEQNLAVEKAERQARLDKAAAAALDRRTKEDKERARKDLAEKQRLEKEDLGLLFQQAVPLPGEADESLSPPALDPYGREYGYIAEPWMSTFQDALNRRIAGGTEFTDEQAEDLKKRQEEATITDTFRPGWTAALKENKQFSFFNKPKVLADQFKDQFESNEEVTLKEAQIMQRMALRAAQAIWNDPTIDLPPGYSPKQIYDDILYERELYSKDHGDDILGSGGDWGPIEGGADAIVKKWQEMNSTERKVVDDAMSVDTRGTQTAPTAEVDTRELVSEDQLRAQIAKENPGPWTPVHEATLKVRINDLLKMGVPLTAITGARKR